MEPHIKKQLNDFDHAIIKFRGVYSAWCGRHGISYNELLVLYAIRDQGFCIQKQLCDSYLVPRQTMNHVIAGMREAGLLEVSPEKSIGREKAFVLTSKGVSYARPFLDALSAVEERAVEEIGQEKLQEMTRLVLEYGQVLNRAIGELGG